MKVLAINSSARKDGNTALLISTVLEELNKDGIETEMIQLAGKVIEPCKACWACGAEKIVFIKRICFRRFTKNGTGGWDHPWFTGIYGKYFRQYAGISGKSIGSGGHEPKRESSPA